VVGDDVERGLAASARERGVGPLPRELLGTSDDDRRLDGRALARVAGDRICVLEMVADVGAIEDALLIRVGPDRD
jgi:hypothetical protein